MTDKIKTVAMIGAGLMGTQIASRAAVFGYDVRLYDFNPDVLKGAKEIIKYHNEAHFTQAQGNPKEADDRVSYHGDLGDAVKDVDFIIEAVAEKLDVKKEIFSEIDKKAPPHAIIGTNSSSLPVSKIEDAVKRKDKVVNYHFAQPIPQRNYVEIVRGTKTSDDTVLMVEDFSRNIECIPLIATKECMGFVINHLWRQVKRGALASWAGGYADFKDIDRGWMKLSGMQAGPFGGMDFIGLDVIYDIEMAYYEDSGDPADKPPDALKKMVDRGELGMKSGKGFYDWPIPEFASPDFLDPKKKG